jgi:hypothetical protein
VELMARKIAVECPVCAANSAAPPHKYLIWVCTTRDHKFFTFTCQECGTPVAKRCPPVVEALLTAEGVARKLYAQPKEIDDPQRRDQRPLSVDDQLDLSLAISEWGVAS